MFFSRLTRHRTEHYVILAVQQQEGNMGLYVHRNHYGLLGTESGGVGNFYILSPTRYAIITRMTPERWAAVRAIFMFR